MIDPDPNGLNVTIRIALSQEKNRSQKTSKGAIKDNRTTTTTQFKKKLAYEKRAKEPSRTTVRL